MTSELASGRRESPPSDQILVGVRRPTVGLMKRLARGLGIDMAVGLSMLTRICGGAIAPLTLLFVTSALTQAEQGYYYTFSGVAGLSMFVELGVGVVLTQRFAAEYAQLRWTPDGTLDGPARSLGRLGSLFRKATYWYLGVAAVTIPLLLVAGDVMFDGSAEGVTWRGPWVLMLLLVTAQVVPAPVQSLLASCGRVSEVARLGFTNLLVSTLALWAGLTMGVGLYAVAIPLAATLTVTCVWLFPPNRRLLRDLWAAGRVGPTVSWWRECFPLQWRVAITWLSAYLGYQALTPIVFGLLGPVAAGQFGMSLNINYSLYALGFTWLHVRLPVFVALAASGRFREFERHLLKTATLAVGLVVVIGVGLVVGLVLLGELGSRYADRILSPLPFACLTASTVCNIIIFAFGTYARSLQKESLFAVNLVVGFGMCMGTWLVCQLGGELESVSVSLLAVNLVCGVGGGAWVCSHLRRQVAGRPSSDQIESPSSYIPEPSPER